MEKIGLSIEITPDFLLSIISNYAWKNGKILELWYNEKYIIYQIKNNILVATLPILFRINNKNYKCYKEFSLFFKIKDNEFEFDKVQFKERYIKSKLGLFLTVKDKTVRELASLAINHKPLVKTFNNNGSEGMQKLRSHIEKLNNKVLLKYQHQNSTLFLSSDNNPKSENSQSSIIFYNFYPHLDLFKTYFDELEKLLVFFNSTPHNLNFHIKLYNSINNGLKFFLQGSKSFYLNKCDVKLYFVTRYNTKIKSYQESLDLYNETIKNISTLETDIKTLLMSKQINRNIRITSNYYISESKIYFTISEINDHLNLNQNNYFSKTYTISNFISSITNDLNMVSWL